MAKLSEEDVRHVANLSKLNLNQEEVNVFQKELSSVILYVESLNEVDTQGVPVTNQTTGMTDEFRDDKIQNERMLQPGEALSGAPEIHNNYPVVPQLIDRTNE